MLGADGLTWRGGDGAVGQVKFAYLTAAVVGGYVLTCDRQTRQWSLVGTVLTSNAVTLRERPLEYVVATKRRAWKWPIESLTITGQTLTARLGAPR